MSKMEILEVLPKLTKTERHEIRLRLAELDSEDWLDDEDPLTDHEKALLDARLYYYLFRDYANDKITKDSAIQRLVNEGISNEEGASIRLGNAKIIFSEKGNCEALLIVQNSKRLSDEIISARTFPCQQNLAFGSVFSLCISLSLLGKAGMDHQRLKRMNACYSVYPHQHLPSGRSNCSDGQACAKEHLFTQHNLVVLNLKLNPTDYPDRSCDESSASVPGRHSLRVHQD